MFMNRSFAIEHEHASAYWDREERNGSHSGNNTGSKTHNGRTDKRTHRSSIVVYHNPIIRPLFYIFAFNRKPIFPTPLCISRKLLITIRKFRKERSGCLLMVKGRIRRRRFAEDASLFRPMWKYIKTVLRWAEA